MPAEKGPPVAGRHHRPRIVALFSEVGGHGGVQRYNRRFCAILTEYHAQTGVSLDILSLHDPLRPRPDASVRLQGCGGSRLRFVLATLQMLRKPYDVVIVGHVDFALLVAPFRLVHPRGRLWLLTHGVEVWTRLPWLKRQALRTITRIWSVSRYTLDRMVRAQGLQASVGTVVPNTLDPDWLAQVRQPAPQPAGQPTILTVSRLHKVDRYKGVDRVIEALPQVRAQVPDVAYTIVGNGDDRGRLEQLARELGVAGCVQFAGNVTDAELHAYLCRTDILVLPSLKEGFGIVFLEAMAYGKPAIAGAHGGSPEVVLHGETGLLVNHADLDALVAAIVDLLLSPAKRAEMGKRGFQRLQAAYHYDGFRRAIMQQLDTFLAGSVARSADAPRRRDGP